MIFLITYDLNRPGKDYSGLHEAIKTSGSSWWHYLESTWLVDTKLAAEQVFAKLRPHIDDNDCLLIVRISRPYQGWLPKDAWEWLNARQTLLAA